MMQKVLRNRARSGDWQSWLHLCCSASAVTFQAKIQFHSLQGAGEGGADEQVNLEQSFLLHLFAHDFPAGLVHGKIFLPMYVYPLFPILGQP